MLPWLDRLREEVPGIEPLDAHTHIGFNDPDGYSCTRAELTASLERIDARAFVFPMHEPDGYSAANDMVIDEAERCRGPPLPVRPARPARRRARRGRARAGTRRARDQAASPRGAVHARPPGATGRCSRSQTSGACRCSCHAGRGIPALGRHSVEATGRHPGMRLILAHAGISDLAWIWRETPDHPNLFFDTSWWSPARPPGAVRARAARPDPDGERRSLRVADLGHGHVRAQRAAGGARRRSRLRGVLGGQALRLVNGEEPLDLGPAPGVEGAVARSAPRPRLLVPHERARPDVPGRRACGDARARQACLRCG